MSLGEGWLLYLRSCIERSWRAARAKAGLGEGGEPKDHLQVIGYGSR